MTTTLGRPASGTGRLITLWTLSGLVALTFIGAGGAKLAGAAVMVDLFAKVGLGQWFRYVTGLLEVAAGIGLLMPRSAFYSAVLLALVMAGASTAHLTVLGTSPRRPVALFVLTGIIAYLRKPKHRQIKDQNMIAMSVIVGSTRQGRFSEQPARWILQHLQKRDGIDARLLDLRDFPMPFFDQAVSPATPGRAPYENAVVQRWTAAIAASDGFVFVTPEYNYGPSAVLKNAIDWVYPEWNRKAAAFVSYGSALGARSVQQLRETVIELQMAPVRSSVHIPVATLWAHFRGGDVDKGLAELETQAQKMIDDLLWWAMALQTARKA